MTDVQSPFIFPTVEIWNGRVRPHGYYTMVHRESWTADPWFYVQVVAFAVFFTAIRAAVSRFVRPLGKALKLPKESNYMKLEESFMQAGIYTWMATYNFTFLLKQWWFWHPLGAFMDGFPRQQLEPEITLFYAVQLGWYLHGIYTHFFLDTKKSDFAIMLVHHTVTLSLLYGAFVVGYFRVGMLVTFSMDFCDIFLYAAKILKLVKSGGVVDYPLAVYYIGFGMIPISWFFLRLVYMPFVVMRTTAIDTWMSAGWENTDGVIVFNALLFILLCLNLWWFSLIVRIMWRSLTMQNIQALDDIREDKSHAYGDEPVAASKKAD